jgi:hypothetical protein
MLQEVDASVEFVAPASEMRAQFEVIARDPGAAIRKAQISHKGKETYAIRRVRHTIRPANGRYKEVRERIQAVFETILPRDSP